MLKTAKVWTAIAVAAVAFPAAAADEAKKPASSTPTQDQVLQRTGDETRPTSSPSTMTKEEKAKDKAAKRASTMKPATTPQEKVLANTATESRPTSTGQKMTPEQKAADKAAKRTGVSPEEQAKQQKSVGGS